MEERRGDIIPIRHALPAGMARAHPIAAVVEDVTESRCRGLRVCLSRINRSNHRAISKPTVTLTRSVSSPVAIGTGAACARVIIGTGGVELIARAQGVAEQLDHLAWEDARGCGLFVAP